MIPCVPLARKGCNQLLPHLAIPENRRGFHVMEKGRELINHSEFYTYIYIYIIYTPNLGLEITRFDREREQGRFRGSSEGAAKEQGGAPREHRGSTEGARGSTKGALWGSAGAQQMGA